MFSMNLLVFTSLLKMVSKTLRDGIFPAELRAHGDEIFICTCNEPITDNPVIN